MQVQRLSFYLSMRVSGLLSPPEAVVSLANPGVVVLSPLPTQAAEAASHRSRRARLEVDGIERRIAAHCARFRGCVQLLLIRRVPCGSSGPDPPGIRKT